MRNVQTILFWMIVGAMAGYMGARAVAPEEPDPAITVYGHDPTSYHVTGWGQVAGRIQGGLGLYAPEASVTTSRNGKIQGAALVVTDGKPEFHDCDVMRRNTESVLRFAMFGVPAGAGVGLLVGIRTAVRRDRKKGVRIAAVKGLTDQATLVKLAEEDKDEDVRNAALGGLAAAGLAKLALEGDEFARYTAVGKLTDQTVLAKIAAEDDDGV